MSQRDDFRATHSHSSKENPEFVRFEIIDETTDAVTGEVVNAKMLKWGGATDGFIDAGRTVYMISLDAIDNLAGLPPTGTKVWGLWSKDVGVWQVVSSAAEGLKKLVRFTLDVALATTDGSCAATIRNQYGPGSDHTTTSITVKNLLTHATDTYTFYGDSGDAGLAYWDTGTEFVIINMECP